MNPRVLFEDAHLLVISKPAGLLSQSDISGEPSLVDYLRTYLGRNYVGLVHRLDRNTTGLMVVAKRSKAANRLTESLQSGQLVRTYIAIVEGRSPERAELDHWLLKDEKTNLVKVVVPGSPGAKHARLSFTRLAQARSGSGELSALHVQLETGRGHQIRAQCAHAGYPLLGDFKYGSRIAGPGRPALHSFTLKFPHPMSHEAHEFKDPLPADLLGLLPRDTRWP